MGTNPAGKGTIVLQYKDITKLEGEKKGEHNVMHVEYGN